MDGMYNELYERIFEVEEENERLREANKKLRSNINALCELYQNLLRLSYSNSYFNNLNHSISSIKFL